MEPSEQDLILEELVGKSYAYYEQGDYQKAKDIIQEVLEIQTRELGEDHLSVSLTLNYIGDILLKEGKSDESIEHYNRALEMQLKKLGENDVRIANTYQNIGEAFLHQENCKKAEEMFRKALHIINLQTSSPEPFILTRLNQHLVLALKRQGKVSDAIKTEKASLAKLLEQHGEDHAEVVFAYICIAQLLADQNRLDDACQLLDKSAEICARLPGGDDLGMFAGTLESKASLLEAHGNFEGATEVLTKLLGMQEEKLGEMDPAIAGTCEKLALAYNRQDMLEDAIEAYAKAINIHKRVSGDDHPHTEQLMVARQLLLLKKNANDLIDQGLAMYVQGDPENAVQLFQESLDIYNERFSGPHSNMATIYEYISDIRVEQGLLEDGIAASAEALKIRRRTLGDDHVDTKGRMQAHRALLKRLLESRR
ncbi:unnamed protein product [Cylindrotheca closterium]|uniref:Kinesin light chain n=1 Tax=Cylindrotheca closterium TaxID=2856 RepID=A0AAD2FNT9_9STRA|nr:unnamed protein product [Cylindrotheca closterium]